MKKLITALIVGASIVLSMQPAKAMDEITVAYFLEWPMPYLAYQGRRYLRKGNGQSRSTGVRLRPVLQCLQLWPRGDVQIAVSQGVPAFRSCRFSRSTDSGC